MMKNCEACKHKEYDDWTRIRDCLADWEGNYSEKAEHTIDFMRDINLEEGGRKCPLFEQKGE